MVSSFVPNSAVLHEEPQEIAAVVLTLPPQQIALLRKPKRPRRPELKPNPLLEFGSEPIDSAIFNDVFQTIPDRLPTDPVFSSIQNLVNSGSNPQFGQFFSTRDPRQIQLGLKFYF